MVRGSPSLAAKNKFGKLTLIFLAFFLILIFRPAVVGLKIIAGCPHHNDVNTRTRDIDLLMEQPLVAPKSILVTGGAGYIGSHMVFLLLDQPYEWSITIVDDLSRGSLKTVERLKAYAQTKRRKLLFEQATVADKSSILALLKREQIDMVIHFAGFAYASESMQFPTLYYSNTVVATNSLMDAMNEAKVHRLLYSSSSATYGSIQDETCDVPIKETSPQNPVSPYGWSKYMSEKIIITNAEAQKIKKHPFSYALLRYFNVVGADPTMRAGALPRKSLSGFGRIVDTCFDVATGAREKMMVYGTDYATVDGTPVRDYIHVSDLVDAHLKVMFALARSTARPEPGRNENLDYMKLVYNIGIGKGSSALELLRSCEEATGKPIPYELAPRREGDPGLVIGDSAKIESELGWKGFWSYNLTHTIKTAWKWKLEHGEEAPA